MLFRSAKYRVLRKAEGESTFTAMAKVTGTSYTDKTAEPGKTYTYTVRLMNDEGKYFGSYDTVGKSITVEERIIVNYSISNTSTGVRVIWDAIDGVAKYRVLRKAEGETSFTPLAKVTGSNYIDKTVEAGKTYTYTVRCMNESGQYIGTYDTVGKTITVPFKDAAEVSEAEMIYEEAAAGELSEEMILAEENVEEELSAEEIFTEEPEKEETMGEAE